VTANSENPFWEFSLTVYRRPGVADACLGLQDRRGLDVNLLLLCCWAGSQGRILDVAEVARLVASVDEWQHSVIRPLREVRRRLKAVAGAERGPLGALRNKVKDCELAAERIEQVMLHDALPPSAPARHTADRQAACAAVNLTAYLEVAGVPMEPEDRADLETVLRGAFGMPEMAERWLSD
jgi:uncharacterized protein (TIGR02444 family)